MNVLVWDVWAVSVAYNIENEPLYWTDERALAEYLSAISGGDVYGEPTRKADA